MKMGTGPGGDCPPSVPEPVPIFQASVTARAENHSPLQALTGQDGHEAGPCAPHVRRLAMRRTRRKSPLAPL